MEEEMEGFNGIIDKVRIYNRTLTQDEIQTLYLYERRKNNRQYFCEKVYKMNVERICDIIWVFVRTYLLKSRT